VKGRLEYTKQIKFEFWPDQEATRDYLGEDGGVLSKG
jgi:hypothetical protein